MKRSTIKLSCLSLLSLVLLSPQNAVSCGPDFPEAIFTYQTRPGGPLKWYAKGNVGLVLPSFERGYLAIAYRYFSGHPLSVNESRDALKYMSDRLANAQESRSNKKDPLKDWLEIRALVLGKEAKAAQILKDRELYPGSGFFGYGDYPNCLDDSFRTAAATLKDRAQRMEAGSQDVQEWVLGQDMVFSDCNKGKVIPTMVTEDRPAWLKADRRYQMAAAYLYSGGFDRAAQQFDEIAQDPSSPWHVIAPYLAARAIVRKGTLGAEDHPDEALLRNAQSRLEQVLSDPSRRGIEPAARKMLNYVAFHLGPEKRTHELARVISGPRPDPNFYQDLIDYTFGLNKIWGDLPSFWGPDATATTVRSKEEEWNNERYQAIAASRTTEITDWILTYRQSGKAAADHAIARWQKQRSFTWLVAAISKVDASNKATGDLLLAAEQVPETSPAYATVFRHRIRLLLANGEQAKARLLLDKHLPDLSKTLNASSLNVFFGERMRLAASFDDFLTYASRPVVAYGTGFGIGGEVDYCQSKFCRDLLFGEEAKGAPQRRFDLDAALTLNMRMPLDLLAKAALDEKLTTRLRGELAVATWTRATMLGQHDVAATLVPTVENAYPVMKDDLENYVKAGSAQEKWHAALVAILRHPGARPYVNAGLARTTLMAKIDDFRDNWWCGDLGQYPGPGTGFESQWQEDRDGKFKERPDAPAYLSFLSSEQRDAARKEWHQLTPLGTAANYLPRQAMKWAKEDPKDPRIPEALHFAVRVTRYGCDNKETSKLSREAFLLLHSRYPNSKWAKETPYWF